MLTLLSDAIAPGIGNGDVGLLTFLVGVGGSLVLVSSGVFRDLAKKLEQNGNLTAQEEKIARQAIWVRRIGFPILVLGLCGVVYYTYHIFVRL
ncbi:MAG: hypothetical protein K0S63_493 [Gammaproteobacteria bacterium]|jgi:hypothetical protein|nr:hypothetical protein [Gammaproteobacteria bacterium]